MKLTKVKKSRILILLLLIAGIGLALYPLPQPDPIHYYERTSRELKIEKVAGERWLVWLYYHPVGEASLWALAKRKLASSIYGKKMDGRASAKKIPPFVEDFDIDLSLAREQEFQTFNDFFTRKLREEARPVDTCPTVLVSPADGKILAYEDISQSDFIIKEHRFDIASFLDNPDLARRYQDGSVIVIRLAPVDYHRFHFPAGGNASQSHKISGDYYSVNPLALRKKAEIFCLNKREFTLVSNPLFGKFVIAEVGATLVGSIVQSFQAGPVNKGEEKGYFKFGGSTVVLLFEKNKIRIDPDLLLHTAKGYETAVKMGERIGVSQPEPGLITSDHEKF